MVYAKTKATSTEPYHPSIFEQLVFDLNIDFSGETVFTHEDPFLKLAKMMNRYTSYFGSVIPLGRSLQKFSSYPDPIMAPRVMIAGTNSKNQTNYNFFGRLFLAYAAGSNSLEVISFNDEKEAFDFFLVTDFKPNGKPKLQHTPPNFCQNCHQSGVPIFSEEPWMESTAFNQDIRKAFVKTHGTHVYRGVPIERDVVSRDLDILPRPERFDDAVTAGALLVAYRDFMKSMCRRTPSVSDCLRDLYSMIALQTLTPLASWIPQKETLTTFQSNFSSGLSNVHEEKIKDHNPFRKGKFIFEMPPSVDPVHTRDLLRISQPFQPSRRDDAFNKLSNITQAIARIVFTREDKLLMQSSINMQTSSKKFTVTVDNNAYELEFQNSGYSTTCTKDNIIIKCQDKKKRINLAIGKHALNQISVIQNKSFYCFLSPYSISGFYQKSKRHQNTLKGICLDSKVKNIIGSFQNSVSIGSILPKRNIIMTNIQKSFKINQFKDFSLYESIKRKRFPTINQDIIPSKPPRVVSEQLKKIQIYCGECHIDGEFPKNFLNANSEAQLKSNIIDIKQKIIDRLVHRNMPATFANKKLPESTRLEIISYLKSLE